MAEFFITLPSNVPDHPENSSSSFLVRLPEPIRLKTEKWKCGLAEIIYTNSFENVPEPLVFTAIGKNGNRTDYYLPAGNYRDPLSLVESLLSTTTSINRRKRAAPTEETKPLTAEQAQQEYAKGNVRPATAEEIEAKRIEIEQRKAKAAALVVASAIASDAAVPLPKKPVNQQQPTSTVLLQANDPTTTAQPPAQPAVSTAQPSKPDDSKKDSKYADLIDNLLNKLAKQTDSASAKIIKAAKQNTDSWIEENKKFQALLQDFIHATKDSTSTIVKEDRANSAKVIEAYKKQADIFVAENQKLQDLFKETITIQKSNAADSKRIANQANLRSYSLGQANEQYSKHGFSFDFDPLLQRIVIFLNKNVLKAVELSPELAYLCGFSLKSDQEPFILVDYKTIATYSIDYNNNLSSIFVYADCIQPSIVGNCKSQLLRIIPTSGQASTISTVFNPIQHLSINKEIIDTIRIRLLDSFGKPIKFHFGTTICTLHFVKIRP